MGDNLIYTLGLIVGDYIIATSLPTLSTDLLKTRTVIEVSEELTKEWKKREENWWSNLDEDKKNGNKIFYENLDWYKKNIEEKYLNDELLVHCDRIERILDKQSFIGGLNEALWDSDLSHYKAVDVNPSIIGVEIKLKRH